MLNIQRKKLVDKKKKEKAAGVHYHYYHHYYYCQRQEESDAHHYYSYHHHKNKKKPINFLPPRRKCTFPRFARPPTEEEPIFGEHAVHINYCFPLPCVNLMSRGLTDQAIIKCVSALSVLVCMYMYVCVPAVLPLKRRGNKARHGQLPPGVDEWWVQSLPPRWHGRTTRSIYYSTSWITLFFVEVSRHDDESFPPCGREWSVDRDVRVSCSYSQVVI